MTTVTLPANSAASLSADIAAVDELSTGSGVNFVIDLTAGATMDESASPEAIAIQNDYVEALRAST